MIMFQNVTDTTKTEKGAERRIEKFVRTFTDAEGARYFRFIIAKNESGFFPVLVLDDRSRHFARNAIDYKICVAG